MASGRFSRRSLRKLTAIEGTSVLLAVGDLFDAAEVHDLNKVSAARRDAVDRDDESR
jgi:hypothetical protein